jgi:hypothetical protein
LDAAVFSQRLRFGALSFGSCLPLFSVRSLTYLGDGVWHVLTAMLPNTAALEVSCLAPPAKQIFSLCISNMPSEHTSGGGGSWRRQVSSTGIVKLESSVGDKGTSTMALSGGKGLGPDGARRLADMFCSAPPLFLASLKLRHTVVLSSFLHCVFLHAMFLLYLGIEFGQLN